MWINNAKTIAILYVLYSHGFEQSGFSGSGTANYIDMRKTVIVFNAKVAVRITSVGFAKK